MSSSAEKVTIA